MRKARLEEQHDISRNCKKIQKNVWKFVYSKTKIQTGVGDLYYINDSNAVRNATTDQDKAEILLKSFSKVFTLEPTFSEDGLLTDVGHDNYVKSIDKIRINEFNILTRLCKLDVNKSAIPDEIYPKDLFEARFEMAYPLKLIFETSITLRLRSESD